MLCHPNNCPPFWFSLRHHSAPVCAGTGAARSSIKTPPFAGVCFRHSALVHARTGVAHPPEFLQSKAGTGAARSYLDASSVAGTGVVEVVSEARRSDAVAE